jgi:competence protein ComEA
MTIRKFSAALLLFGCTPALWAGPVNINSADAATIARELKGIGLSKAEAIVEYRQKHGPFHSADELASVRGIGRKTIEHNRADIRLDRPASHPGAVGAPQTRPAKPDGR